MTGQVGAVPGRERSRHTLRAIARRFPGRIALTFGLVLIEAAAMLFFPLVIGVAVDDLLHDSYAGLTALLGLGTGALVVGAARRFYDTRAYSAIYEVLATELAARERDRGTPVSAVAARTTLMSELVEFLENAMPMLVNAAIGIVGTLVILAGIDARLCAASLGLMALVILVYVFTGTYNWSLTAGYNDELEQQVSALAAADASVARGHFGRLMSWNRRLSDLETVNYSLIYLGVLALMVYGPLVAVSVPGPAPQYGLALATTMYVFQYIEAVLEVPLFLQQGIRLKEISERL